MWLRRLAWAAGSFASLVFILWFVPQVLDPTPPTPEERLRDRRWVDSSPYWLDRQTCRWLSLCGVHHLKWDAPALDGHANEPHDGSGDGDELRRRAAVNETPAVLWRESLGQESWEIAGVPGQQKRAESAESLDKTAAVPQYVLDYAPLVHLFSGENFWPSRIDEHVRHMVPYMDGRPMDNTSEVTLDNLGDLNGGDSAWVYLTSEDDVEARPEWLHSHAGIPVPFPDNDDDDDDDDHNGGHKDEPQIPPTDAQNGHDYQQPPPRFADDTTWYEVDDDHPLHRIADPRKLGLNAQKGGLRSPTRTRTSTSSRRRQGPAAVRAQQARRQQVVVQAPGQYELPLSTTPDNNNGHPPDPAGHSRAPATLVLVDKGAGIVDAFWFFFYSYNLGQTVLKVRYGNHVGDWEHCMIRFENGVPRALFLSEHAGGQAYAWQALEKRGRRPVIYSAVGSHAMYALPGTHPYVLPFKMLRDETDRGPLWDPAAHHWAYHYDAHRANGSVATPGCFRPAASNPQAPTSWFDFAGPWGDELLPLGDPRQWRLFGQYHYISGPAGPKFKNLARAKVCQTERCRLLYSLDAGKKASWYS